MKNKIELSEEDLIFIKEQYIKLKQHNRGVWSYADLSDTAFNSKLQVRNIELYFSILHDAISYELLTYEEILSRNNLKEDFYKFYQGFINKISKSEDYSIFLEKRVEELENRFGLVWKDQEEQLLKIINENEVIVGTGRFILDDTYQVIEVGKSKRKELLKEQSKFSLVRKKEEGFLYYSKDLDSLFVIYANKVYKFKDETFLEYYPILTKKNEDYGFGEKRNNLLIEGDNYFALQLLQYSHKEKIDVIYIDPPYNTGSDDFKYNDSYIGSDDGGKHSKWLSFMEKRLKLAKNLLAKDGIIFISIDDHEQAQLKLLCDQIFTEDKIAGIIHRRKNRKPHNAGKTMSLSHEFILSYYKDITFKLGQDFDEMLSDSKGNFAIYPVLQGDKKERIYSFKPGIPVLGNLKKGIIKANKNSNLNIEILDDPIIINGMLSNEVRVKGRFRLTDENGLLSKAMEDGNIFFNENGFPKEKRYRTDNDIKIDNHYWDIEKGRNEDGNDEIKNIFQIKGDNDLFKYPKPIALIKKVLKTINKKDAIVLDFFAGSGTTGHAVIELNQEDEGSRQYILITNNENKICEDVTYERLLRINNPQKYNLNITPCSHGLEYLQLKHISKIDIKKQDIVGSFHSIKYITNIKFNASQLLEENDIFYITDTYAVFKKQKITESELNIFEKKVKLYKIQNIIYLGSKLSDFKVFQNYFKELFNNKNIHFMSKDFMDYMINIISSEKNIELDEFYINENIIGDNNDKQ